MVDKETIFIFERFRNSLLRRDSKRCPAIILAVNRTERVMGRINILVNSIRTMMGMRKNGVPVGRK